MENLEIVASIYLLFGSAMSLLMGVELLIGRNEQAKHNTVLFFVSLLVSIILYHHVLFGNEIIPEHPWLAFFYLTALYSIGPLIYLYYLFLMYPFIKFRIKRFLGLIPAACIFLFELYLQAQPYSLKHHVLSDIFYTTEFSFLLVVQYIGGVMFVTYQVIIIIVAVQLWNDPKIKNGARLIVILEVMNILAVVPIGIWMFKRNNSYYLASGFMTTSVMIIVFLTKSRFPRIFNLMRRELVSRRYQRSFLKGLDTRSIKQKLSDLMKDEKIYRDYALNLQILAQKMSLTPHQLSQFLNEQLKSNFNQFLNQFRIEEAKILLKKNTDHTVLTIGYFVGFNSKSAFNKIFKNFTGCTPTEFRRNIRSK
jgi:AraC-like DNA-binding protein